MSHVIKKVKLLKDFAEYVFLFTTMQWTLRGEARISAVGVLKGVILLQWKFAMVGESEPTVITNSGVCGSTPLRQYCTGARPQPDALVGVGNL
jgi:hypothetical protein